MKTPNFKDGLSKFKEKLLGLKKPSFRVILIAACVVVGLCVLYFVFLKKDANANLVTQQIKRANIEQSIEAVGEVYAKEQVDVGAQVSGQITKLYVQIGDRVKVGDLIAQIDKDKQQNELDIIKAQFDSAKANLESKEVSLEIASSQYKREQQLYENKATSLENLETLKNNYYTLKANVAELKAQVVQLEIQLKNAEKDLGYTTITAPMDGIVINVAVDEGQTVNANQTTPTIVKIANLDEMEIRMEIAEADVNKIKLGTKVKFSILNDPDTKFEGEIASIDPANTVQSDATSTSSSTTSSSAIYYYAKVFVKNEENFLRIGMSVENSIVIASVQNALSVPTYIIQSDDKGYFVELLKGGKSVKSYVKIGIKDSVNAEILEGVQEGDTLIVSGANSVKKSTSSKGGAGGPPPF